MRDLTLLRKQFEHGLAAATLVDTSRSKVMTPTNVLTRDRTVVLCDGAPARREDLKLIHVITFELTQHTRPRDTPTSQTDRQTDDLL